MVAPAEAKVREALTKLTIGKGGKFSRKSLGGGWEISLSEPDRRLDHADAVGVLTISAPPGLRYSNGSRTTRARLGSEALFTKSKSLWRRDCVWRLRPEVIEKWVAATMQAFGAVS